jgi:hypothetical protein
VSGESPRDPFADLPLLGELRERLEVRFRAAEQQPLSSGASVRPPLRRRWLARHSRLLAVLGVLLLAAGTATAAITLGGTPSAPLSGSVPGFPSGTANEPGRSETFTEVGKQYRIVFAPQLSGGEAGWRTFIGFDLHGRPEGGEGGEAGYPTHSTPLAGGAGVGFTSAPLPSGDAVDYVLSAPRVAAVRVGTRTIRTRAVATLPAEDRAAVFFVPAGSPPVAIPPAGARLPYYIRVPVMRPLPHSRGLKHVGAGHFYRERPILTPRGRGRSVRSRGPAPAIPRPRIRTVLVRATPLIPLDREGHAIAYTPPRPQRTARRIGAWQVAHPGEHHPGAAATHPLPGACEIAQDGLPGLRAQWGHVLARIEPVTDAEGELFLSCVDTEYFLHGWPLDSAILLDARRPGLTLGPLPGASPVAGHPGVVNVALGSLPGDLTARRVGNAWLVVESGASLAQRLRVLDALRIAKLSLPPR